MNLAEALNAALPEMPAHRARVGHPRLDPNLIANEQIEDGKPVVVTLIRGTSRIYRFEPGPWRIAQLFDGTRSVEDVAQLFAELYGVVYAPEDVQEFVNSLEAMDFWYRTPLEKNIALRQKLQAGRHEHAHQHSKIDVAHMKFSAWDPDRFFDRVYPWIRWMYTRWFAVVCGILFAFMTWIFIANWGEIGRDTLEFYTFTDKSAADLAEFWILFLVLGYFHESAHGLTCKHYGGQVHAMGFHLIYLSPAFFVDVSETLVYATRWQRLVTILAGVGVELIFCAVATVVWWGTPPGSGAHDLAYKIILITGVAVVVVNMNPLIKLDGYFAFSEIIGFPEIKEKSTAYLSQLVRRRVFGLPVEVEYVPKRRRAGFLLYAVLSGLYSYMLLLMVVRFCDHVFARYSPQWAILPALALALVIFRSRIRTLLRLMKTVYLDKRDRVRAWLTGPRLWAGAAAVLLLLLLPLFHETVTARFVLEPAQWAVVRATVPGRVAAVMAVEGQTVRAGDALVRLTSTQLDSARAGSSADFALTAGARVEAQLGHKGLGAAIEQNARAGIEEAVAVDEAQQLTARAPIDGMVMAPHLGDLVGSTVAAGTTITEIAGISAMRARVFVPEYAVGRVRSGGRISLLADGAFRARRTRVIAVEPEPGEMPAGVESIQQIKGGANLEYYVADAVLDNDGSLRSGMTGTARIEVRRASLAEMAVHSMRDFVERKVW